MIRWAKIIVSGLLAAAVVATLAWAGPRRGRDESSLPRSPTNPGRNDNSRKHFAGKLPITELNEQEAILHALNRLGFGPSPGEVEQIEKTGLENWIQAQLHPETMRDATVEARLAAYSALNLSATNLLDQYPQQDAAAKRLHMTPDEYRKHIEELAKQPQGTNSLPFKDPQAIVNSLMEMN